MTDAQIASALTDGFYAAADVLLMEATNPWELDAAMTDFGFADGVCAMQDAVGLDEVLARGRAATCSQAAPMTPVLPRMVSEGRLGRKAGVGWYRYPGGGGLVIDPLVEDLLREEAWFSGRPRTELDHATMLDRLICGGVRAVLRLLPGHEVMQKLDRISVESLGFPKARGGALIHTQANCPE